MMSPSKETSSRQKNIRATRKLLRAFYFFLEIAAQQYYIYKNKNFERKGGRGYLLMKKYHPLQFKTIFS